MSTPTHSARDEQEIDLNSISRGIGNAIDSIGRFIFNCIQFLLRNIIIVGILLLVGAGLGYFLDSQPKSYEHQVIVTPNFASTDYLYSKVELLDSKIRERDTTFLKSIGIQNPKKLGSVSIKPIVDVYRFVGTSEYNFKVLELLAEAGDLNKIVEDTPTSKNYLYHQITYSTKGPTNPDQTLKPLIAYFNQSEFFSEMQQTRVENIKSKIRTNDTLIAQIDAILNNYGRINTGFGSGGNMIHNENTQLNEVIRTKDELIIEQGELKVALINSDKIVKDISSIVNVENDKFLSGKMKFILPLVLIMIFVALNLFGRFYKYQSLRHSSENNI